jgi:hypothetical protein
MDEDAAEVFVVFFDAEVELFDFGALEETEHAFFQLAAPLPRDDLDQRDAFFNGFADHAMEFRIDLTASIEDIMQIQLDFCHYAALSKSMNPLAGSMLISRTRTFWPTAMPASPRMTRPSAGGAIIRA